MTGEIFEIEGLRELDQALAELSAPVARRLGVKALIRAAEPLVEAMEDLAPVGEGYLTTHIAASTKLSRRQKATHQKQSDIEVFVGPENSASAQAVQQEFGNVNHAAQPFARPAWDATRMDVMLNVKEDLAKEIEDRRRKAAAREARRIARAQAGA